MKNLIAFLCLVFIFMGTTQAQIDRYRFPQTPPASPLDLRFNCADLQVTLTIHRILKVSKNNFKVIFKATLKNVGRQDFNDWDNPAIANLGPSSNHPNPTENAVMVIPHLRAGQSRVTYLSMPWSASWRVAPSINFSLDAHRADCYRNNNQAKVTHHAIVQRFRRENPSNLPFGRF